MKVVFVDGFSRKKYLSEVDNDDTVEIVIWNVIGKKLRMYDVRMWHREQLMVDDHRMCSYGICDGDEITVEYDRMDVFVCDYGSNYDEHSVTVQRNWTVRQLLDKARERFRFDESVRLRYGGRLLGNSDTMDELILEFNTWKTAIRDVDDGETYVAAVSVGGLLKMAQLSRVDECRLHCQGRRLNYDDWLNACSLRKANVLRKERQCVHINKRDSFIQNIEKICIKRNGGICQLIAEPQKEFQFYEECVGGMKIFVQEKNGGKIHTFMVPVGESIGQLYQTIRDVFGPCCRLSYREQTILSGENLASCGISDGDVVDLDRAQVFVKYLSMNKNYTFPYQSDMKVNELIHDLRRKTGHDVGRHVWLSCNDKILENDETLLHCGVMPGNTMYCGHYLNGVLSNVNILAVTSDGTGASVVIELNCNQPVHVLRQKIAQQLNVPPWNVTLQYNGRMMNEDDEIDDALGETVVSIRSDITSLIEYNIRK